MKFRDIAIKNFRVNLKKYLSYFLCSSFSIMIFFMYSTLLFNKSIKDNGDKDIVNIIFYISMTVIALFAVFFINYAHTAFIKSRYKEFGVYMILGMTTKDIRRIILIENLLIALASLVSGILSGLIFSRLFQMAIASILGIEDISYRINPLCFLLTIGIFAAIFLLVFVFGNLAATRMQIGELLKKSRRGESDIRSRLLPGILGLLLLAASLTCFILISNHEKLNSNFALVVPNLLLIFAGVYLSVSYLGLSFMALLKQRKNSYYKHLLVVTEIAHKYNQNKRIIFVLSILSSMIVFFVASPFSLYSLSDKISGMNQPSHIEFASVYGINRIDDAAVSRILSAAPTGLTDSGSLEFLALPVTSAGSAGDKPGSGATLGTGSSDLLGAKMVISESQYNTRMHTKLRVPDGQIFNAITAWQPGSTGIVQGEAVTVTAGSFTETLDVLDSRRAPWISSGNSFPSSSGMVVSDADYARLKAATPADSVGILHTFMFRDWKKTGATVQAFKAALAQANAQLPDSVRAREKLLTVMSRLDAYETLKRAYTMFVFVTAIMGLLFFIAAGSVLFFKQYTEIGEARQKFYKLFKIGIARREAEKVVTRELLVTFFTPLIFGSILGYAFIYFMTHLVGGQDIMGEFMQNATKVVAAYFLFQAWFFLITRKNYIREVLGNF